MSKIRILLEKNKRLVLAVAVMGILVDIFLPGAANDLIIFTLTVLWIGVVWIYKLKERVLVRSGLLLVAICPLFLIIKEIYRAEKVAIWAFVFLTIGVLGKTIAEIKQAWQREK